jgi:triosephosphate isomerase
MKRKLVLGNWKMNGLAAAKRMMEKARAFAEGLA